MTPYGAIALTNLEQCELWVAKAAFVRELIRECNEANGADRHT